MAEDKLICCLCGKEIEDKYGHNPWPLVKDEKKRCCAKCNKEKVIPARLGMYFHRCKRCGYEWLGRLEKPVQCARCHSTLWDKERKRKKKE